MSYFYKNDEILIRFATAYMESVYPDLALESDPYGIINMHLSTDGSGINFVLEDGKLFLVASPADQDEIKREVTKELIKQTLFMFEVSLENYTVIEEFSDKKLKELGRYSNEQADYTLSINTDQDTIIHKFIKFKNEELINKIYEFELPTK